MYPKKLYRTDSDYLSANHESDEKLYRSDGYVSEDEFRTQKLAAAKKSAPSK